MKLEKVKKLRKGLLIALVAGVVVSQAAPAIHSGTKAHADDASGAADTTGIIPANKDEEEILEEADGDTTEPTDDAEVTTPTTPADGKTDPTKPAEPSTPAEGETEPTDPEGTTDPAVDPAEQTDEETDADAEEPAETVTEDTEEADAAEAEVAEEAVAEEAAPAEEPVEQKPHAPASYEQDETWYPVPSGELVPSPVIYRGFRFWTVAKDYAFATADINILEEKNSASRTIGTLEENGLCFVLKSEDGWYYVESGDVRGFVAADDVVTGEDAQGVLAVYDSQAELLANVSGEEESVDTIAPMAEAVVSKDDNAAYDYYRATVYQTVVQKDYALPTVGMVNIREDASEDGRVVGILSSNSICYVIADRDSDWVYVESGDVRGFVKRDLLVMADEAGDDSILTKEEEDYTTATESIIPEENGALYYTMTSVRSGVPDGMERSSILQYAAEFIGNPYVWGGTSLTNGADCSGFVQSIFAQYGYSLPRTAAEQSQVGEQIAVEDAQPGDLIFYGRAGHVYHVVIYAGDGKTIEAKSRRAGIVASEVSYKNAVWATRILDETQATQFEIPDGLGSVHSYMGWQKVTMRGSQQYAFREAAGMTFDPEGFGVVDNRYVIACTTTFGNIGDYVDFYQEDGSVIPCIIGDFKNQNDAGCNAYGHLNGDCIVEFVVDQNSWYHSGHANPGTSSCHPEWHQDIVKAVNVGSFYE